MPGLSEPLEKVFETARDIISHDIGFCAMDWFGQGGSGRYLENTNKRHGSSFEEDLLDFEHFMNLMSDKISGARLILLGHSMGGHLGLRYLHDHPDTFERAAVTSPMVGILAVGALPLSFSNMLGSFLDKVASEHYVPGGSDWNANFKDPLEGRDFLS